MKLLSMFLILEILFLWGRTHSLAETILRPHTYNEDFESGSVGAWSSYPPAQDTAYDPTIWVKPVEGDESNKALFREITPNYESDYVFGVRKKLKLYVDRTSILSFECYIKSNRSVKGVKVLFGFDDGFTAERTIPFSTRLAWRDCSIEMADIIPDVTKKLTAVAFMALCPNADPENLLRFGINNVKINGMREENWEFNSPTVHKLDEWDDFIAGTHFSEGGRLTISGNAPFNVGSAAVIISRALTGENEKVFRMKRSGSKWAMTIPLTEVSGITAGLWRATIKASSHDQKDDFISTDMVFLVKDRDAPKTNPRIFMTSGDAAKILEKTSSGRMKNIWQGMINKAINNREKYNIDDFNYNLEAYDEIYWLPTYGGYVGAIRVPSNYIRSNGVVYGVSGDVEAGDAACKALLKMAQWPTFVHSHILNQGQFTYWPVGQILADLAIGYDMVRDRLSPEERKQVADALFSKGIMGVFKEYVRDNRVSSNTSNWIGDVTGGGILCALAVMNDFPPEELEPYLTGMILKMNALIENGFDESGAYGEGYSYLNHALHCMNVALPALERTFKIRFPDKLSHSYEFLIYHLDPETKDLYDFGDSATRLGKMSNFAYLVSKYRDPHLKWLYDLSPGTGDVDLFLLDESVEANPPDNLPGIRLFKDVGTAVFRSGFGHEDFMFIFRCGPFYNHQHFDQGSFVLYDRGECFLGEMGKSDYYNDPWYQKLVIQPGGHNCILVNNNPESQRAGDLLHDVPAWKNSASIADFMPLTNGAFVSGRLDPIYKEALDYLRRSIIYIKPRTVLLIDEIIGTSSVKTVNLRFHAPFRDDITIKGKNAFITRPGGTLSIHTVSPTTFTAEIHKRPLTLTEFGRETALTMKARGFLQLSANLGNGSESTTFVNVLSTDDDIISALNDRKFSDHIILTVGTTEYIINTAVEKQYSEGSITTDALVYAEKPNGYCAMRVKNLTIDSDVLLNSESPVSIEFEEGTIKTVTYSAPEKTNVTLKIGMKPKGITLNGMKYKNWKYTQKRGLSIILPAGEGVVGIR